MINILDAAPVCGEYLGTAAGIPAKLAFLVAIAIRIIQVGVPILLIIWGMLDLGKAVMAQKEEEIKKGQNTFIKRLIAAVIVFFVITIVKLMVSLFAGGADGEKDGSDIWGCIQEIVSCSKPDCSD